MFQNIFLNSDKLLVTMALGMVVVSCVLCLGMFNAHRGWSWSYPLSWMPTTANKRHTPTSKTPSGSLAPTEKSQSNANSPVKSKELSSEEKKPSSLLPTIDFRDTFPPSSREALLKAAEKLPPARRQAIRAGQIDQAEFRKDVMSMHANYRECGPSSFTPTGISVEEIDALQDFPDYSELSGVPLPKSYEEFKIETALPRPYRPFRWVYHQTMSLTRLEPDWWLELENTYCSRIQERKSLFAKHGKDVLQYLPGSELACKELMEICLQFLCARYPQYFSLRYSHGEGYVFHNGLLKNETIIKNMHPLNVLLENVPEDFAVMLRNPDDGFYYLRAGLLCSSLGWNVSTKIGMQLKKIHEPIPDYKEKMEFSMDRYFAKLATTRPIQRGSWGLEIDSPLFMPPGDPHEVLRLQQNPKLALDRVNLRVDWQTLRRLPLSGAIIFNFKALFTPITEFRDEAYIPTLCLKVLKEGKENIMRYKNTWHVEHVAIPALERWADEQVKEGKVEKDWKVETLAQSPWFPGWEEKWRGRQGFGPESSFNDSDDGGGGGPRLRPS